MADADLSASDPRRLLASIHDVGPRFAAEVDALADLLTGAMGAQARFAMLVVPDHWGERPLAAEPAFQARLRAWSDAGVEMFVHGWYHRDTAVHRGGAAIKARWMTAREGEFLGLSRLEAARRMADGKALVEDVIGRAAAGFVAPAWLYGEGARAALPGAGFALAEDHLRVWRPADGRVLARGPVITWASRSGPRTASSLAVAALARRALSPLLATIRVAVHPGDMSKCAIVASIDAIIRRFGLTHRPARYAELDDAPPGGEAGAVGGVAGWRGGT